MSRSNHARFVFAVSASTLVAALAAGCQNDGGSDGGGRVVSRTQNQDVTPGGTAIQTRTQIRETPSGERVRETQMRTREVVTPAGGGGGTDATRSDPSR